MKTVVCGVNDSGQRIDKFLMKYFKNLPLSLIYKFIRKNRVKVNGKKVKEHYKLCEDDVIYLYVNDELFSDVKTAENVVYTDNYQIDIVYEDENLILVNKKAGMLVHSENPGDSDTLIDRIKSYLYHKGEYDSRKENSFAPALCNRIDRNTQGIVIAAKNARTLRFINEKIKTREIKKYYYCVCDGIFDKKTGELSDYLVKDKNENKMRVVRKDTKDAKLSVTRYRVIKEFNGVSLLEIELITGRTHQIRAQLANISHPLTGDTKYGKKDTKFHFRHQALCAYRIEFDIRECPGEFSYLNGKSFAIDEKDIKFVEIFG